MHPSLRIAVTATVGCTAAIRGRIRFADLQRVEYPHWWRMPDRAALLDGLLALRAALGKVEGENR
ncbi:MAG: hypothetical protein AMXMBFR4_02070 [Candidatus Hydrogenedentota bacterium]